MKNRIRRSVAAAAVIAAASMAGGSAQAAEAGVKAGFLTCQVASGWGFVLGSSRALKCEYSAGPKVSEHYAGTITKFGVDIGYLSAAVIVWAVVAPTATVESGALAGDYAGATGSAAVVGGVGANVLVGGSGNHIELQPVSLEGQTGLNVAGGIAELHLTVAPAGATEANR